MESNLNKIKDNDLTIHDWYRFVLSFPPHLVRSYLDKFDVSKDDIVLDPFCGTGTTNIECKKCGIPSLGIEANTMTYFASKVKSVWNIDGNKMYEHALQIAEIATERLCSQNETSFGLSEEQRALILKNSICDQPLSHVLLLEDVIKGIHTPYEEYFLLALAKHIVLSYSNLKFGPEIGIKRKKVQKVDVVSIWLEQIAIMQRDISENEDQRNIRCEILNGDARNITQYSTLSKVRYVITSPPYPNEKDYSRITRLESVLLGFIKNREDLRKIKNGLLRSNTKNVYKGDNDNEYIKSVKSIMDLSEAVERRRIELGKKSGFERLYARVVQLYFGGMAKHLRELKTCLLPGARLAYVIGDQASYFQIPIKTAELIGEVAEMEGYTVENIETFRTRFSTTTGTWLNEDVLILKYK